VCFVCARLKLSGVLTLCSIIAGFHKLESLAMEIQVKLVRSLGKTSEREYFGGPFGVAIGSDRRVYVADDLANKIVISDRDGTFIKTIGQKGPRPGEFAWLDAVTLDSGGGGSIRRG
jgi:hypothetical protein